jgi:hypothetical protein
MIMIISGPLFSISNSIIKLFVFGLGYLLTSVFYQFYSLFIKNDDFYQKWFVPVSSVVTDQPDETEISLNSTEKEKVSDSQQEQV